MMSAVWSWFEKIAAGRKAGTNLICLKPRVLFVVLVLASSVANSSVASKKNNKKKTATGCHKEVEAATCDVITQYEQFIMHMSL